MNKEKYYPPIHAEGKYHCPHCTVFAKQFWAHIAAQYLWPLSSINNTAKFDEKLDKSWSISKCEHCNQFMIWKGNSIIFPKKISVPYPNEDLNPDIQADYLEAANIFKDSPRATAALLRLALQKLCRQLGEKGSNINDDIKNLVIKGLNPQIQKSLDILRITGNNAVHPGEINLDEDPEKVLKLFEILNFIATKMLTEPKEIDSFYENLPAESKKAIEKRDRA